MLFVLKFLFAVVLNKRVTRKRLLHLEELSGIFDKSKIDQKNIFEPLLRLL